MDTTVRFSHVSKKYQLGLTRTSLPQLISDRVVKSIRRDSQMDNMDRYFWALRDVSFEMKRGQSLGLIGPNGAGKSTILKLLANITRPTSGQIEINGKLSALIELGAGFHPDLTGRENILLYGTIMGLSRKEIESRFDEIVEFSELERFIGTPLKRYSSGMAVRLGFAVAACINPDILLVDEVLAVGDTSFRLKCIKRIEELIEAGATLIFVSHNMGLVKAVCDSSIYIDEGQVKYIGNTDEAVEVYNRSLNERRIQKLKISGLETADEQGTVDISKVAVTGLDSTTEGVIRTNEGAKVTIQYFAYRDIGPVTIVARIIRSDGLWCCVFYSRVDEFQLSLMQGEGIVSITIDPLQLYPGKYGVAVTMKNASESMSYDIVLSDWFQVEGNAKDIVDRDAVFEPDREWGHQRVESQIISPDGLSS